MAGELTYTSTMAANTGTGSFGFVESETPAGTALVFNLDATKSVFTKGTMATSTSAAAIPVGAIGVMVWAWLKNLDATNSISIQVGSGGTANLVTIPPGCVASFPMGVITPFAKASASTPQLQYFLLGTTS